MNNEKLKELIEKYSYDYGNDLVDGLEIDFDGKVVSRRENEHSSQKWSYEVVEVEGGFVEVAKHFYRMGHEDYSLERIDAYMVEPYEVTVIKYKKL